MSEKSLSSQSLNSTHSNTWQRDTYINNEHVAAGIISNVSIGAPEVARKIKGK